MCCFTNQAFSKVAEEDIYVYKVFDCYEHCGGEEVLMSPLYSGMTYHVGDNDIRCGYFYTDVTSENNLGLMKGTYRVDYGFHSFKNKEDAFALLKIFKESPLDRNSKVYKCRIKKGTDIYVGYGKLLSDKKYECYVSEKIDIIERVDF